MNPVLQPNIVRTPGYYIRQRLLQNGPAMVGLTIVLLAVFVAISGSLLIPDKTPNANDGIVELQKKPAGFTVLLLQVPKEEEVADVSFWEKWVIGQPSKSESLPVRAYEIK